MLLKIIYIEKSMLKKIYDKCVSWAGHKYANPILAVVSFAESFIFPIPTDAMIIPMVIAKREKFLKIAHEGLSKQALFNTKMIKS